MPFKLISLLSEAYCVLDLDGGMQRDGYNIIYKDAPQRTHNEQNECSILGSQLPPFTPAISLLERTCGLIEGWQ